MKTLYIDDLIAQADGLMYQEKRHYHFGLSKSTAQNQALALCDPITSPLRP